jgi:hypothetical protein
LWCSKPLRGLDSVKQYGGEHKAEAELAEREKRVRKLDIRGLTRDEKNKFAENWKRTQAHFVDAPSPAVSEADGLVKELMLARRYPVGEFEQRAADISVDHPDVVNNYRKAHDMPSATKAAKRPRKICDRRWCITARSLKSYWKRQQPSRPTDQNEQKQIRR